MTLETQPQITSRSTISDSGQTLQIPSFDDKHTLELRFREQGRRLYTPHDTTLADSLLALTQRAAALWLERENSLRAERQRIMRDLHDDVASRLLTLAHRVQEPALSGQARDALNALRQAIFELDEQAPVSLSDLLLTLQAQLRERARAHNIEVAWEEPVTSPAVMFNSREQINLQRIFDEAQSNAIRHCAPDEFSVKIKIENQMLIFEICNNGFILPKEEWVKGKGMNNIQRRINELQGNSHWTVKAVNNKQHQTCCLELSLPLPVHIS